ncbi:uncharacterized protein P174DRAFT_212405 [Aspergillus novofumigatus IBT 16806]|uniref:Uncharacterized protein n=1 Tax=Aspergillus novofumigatus (strain IBT 16806) TaxID=1392255 RepID=A0A2I1C560_ASPN1|nr:uncharacterized protein P174DRAFT_212405 [Aspergillus novofumigatus IBT 16806]PKX92763.1 hypothetical protein P174DRAFT_212405 [Aspergillus novofumigatus IBT 16806]
MPLFWFPTKELTVVCSLWLLYPLPPTIIDSLGSASFPPPVLDFFITSMDSLEMTPLETSCRILRLMDSRLQES